MSRIEEVLANHGTVVRKASYTKSDPEKNNNKFWDGYECSDCTFIADYGRVGENREPHVKSFETQAAAAKFFDQKCKSKEKHRNGEIPYQKLEVLSSNVSSTSTTSKVVVSSNLKSVAMKQIKGVESPETAKLVDYLEGINRWTLLENTTMQYDVDSGLFMTPRGLITQDFLDKATGFLSEIGDLVADAKYGSKALNSAVGQYLMHVPQDVGRKLDVEVLFPDIASVQKQKGILDSLQASIDVVMSGAGKKPDAKKASKDSDPRVFQVKLKKVSEKKLEKRLFDGFYDTRSTMHNSYHYTPVQAWGVKVQSMEDAFEKDGAKMKNVIDGYHSSEAANILSILSTGINVPPSTSSHVTGRLFGDGVYTAPCGVKGSSTKSLNYATGYWGQGRSDRTFMFILEQAMGKAYTPSGRNYTRITYPQKGHDSTWAKANESGVRNDECIVYRASQVRIKYLIEFKR
jgi:poly [ADP-ribose] polymerase